MPKFAVIGEFSPTYKPHITTNNAIGHTFKNIGIQIDHEWLASDNINADTLNNFQGFLIAPATTFSNMESVLTVIKHARDNNIPLLGTGAGFQLMIIDLARNLLSFFDAQHGEYAPEARHLFIKRLTPSLAGRELAITLAAGSHIARLYGTTQTSEHYYADFGVNPAYAEIIKASPLKIVAADAEGEIRAIEHATHPFFIGTLFAPQAHSTDTQPHPLISAFIEAVEQSQNNAPQVAAAREFDWEL